MALKSAAATAVSGARAVKAKREADVETQTGSESRLSQMSGSALLRRVLPFICAAGASLFVFNSRNIPVAGVVTLIVAQVCLVGIGVVALFK